MASNDSLKSEFEKLCECLICLDRMEDPRTLHCGHSFCKECLESLVKFEDNGVARIKCPNRCRDHVLPPNKRVDLISCSLPMKQMLGVMQQQHPMERQYVKCNEKDCTKTVEIYCKECLQYLCLKCSEQLHKSLSGHTLIHAKYSTKRESIEPYCLNHKCFQRYTCASCDATFLCMYCKQLYHIDHNVSLLNTHVLKEYFTSQKLKLQNLKCDSSHISAHVNTLKKRLRNAKLCLINSFIVKANETENMLLMKYDAKRKIILDGFEEINVHKQALLSQLELLEKKNDMQIMLESGKLVTDVESFMLSNQHLLESAEQVPTMQIATDFDIAGTLPLGFIDNTILECSIKGVNFSSETPIELLNCDGIEEVTKDLLSCQLNDGNGNNILLWNRSGQLCEEAFLSGDEFNMSEVLYRMFQDAVRFGFSSYISSDRYIQHSAYVRLLFQARYNLVVDQCKCAACNTSMLPELYHCRICNIDLCSICYRLNMGLLVPNHLKSHKMDYLSEVCATCKSYIVGKYIHCKVCNLNVCAYCYQTCKFKHDDQHQISVLRYNLGELIDCMSEEKELSLLAVHSRYFSDALKVGVGEWKNSFRNRDEKIQKNMKLAVARFSEEGLSNGMICNSCFVDLAGKWYRCLNCFDLDVCDLCYLKGIKKTEFTNGHDVKHTMMSFRYKCTNCRGFIIGPMYSCIDCVKNELCTLCYKSKEFPSSHKS